MTRPGPAPHSRPARKPVFPLVWTELLLPVAIALVLWWLVLEGIVRLAGAL